MALEGKGGGVFLFHPLELGRRMLILILPNQIRANKTRYQTPPVVV